jgi:hypothetical protein
MSLSIKPNLEKIFLIALCVFGLIYSFEFGLILTAYPHGGQLLGLVFEFVLIIYSCVIIFSKSKNTRQVFRIINYSYLISMTLYVLTIKIVKHLLGDKSWEYLHVFNPPELSNNEKIFNAFAVAGALVCMALIIGRWIRNKKNKSDNNRT